MLIRKSGLKENLYIVHTRYTQKIIKTTIGKQKNFLNTYLQMWRKSYSISIYFSTHFPGREKENKCIVFFRKLFLRHANDLSLATERVRQSYADYLSDVGPLYAISITDYFYIFIFISYFS